jgi:hypothetical protein
MKLENGKRREILKTFCGLRTYPLSPRTMTLSKVRLRNAIDLGIQILLNYSLRFLTLVSLLENL